MSKLLQVAGLMSVVAFGVIGPMAGCTNDSEAKGKAPKQPSKVEQAIDNSPESIGEDKRQAYLDSLLATCADIAGTVEGRRAGDEDWQALGVGCDLRDAELVRTAAGAGARLRFGRKGSIEIRESSQVMVRQREEPALSLLEGSVAIVLGDAPRALSQLVVVDGEDATTLTSHGSSKVAVAGLTRGSGELVVLVASGEVGVRLAGVDLAVPAGRAVRLTGSDAGQPFDVMAAPSLLAPTHDSAIKCGGGKGPVQLRWDAVPGAAQYKVEIASDEAFAKDVVAATTEEPKLGIDASFPETRYWRVSAIDGSGLPGQASLGKFSCARPPQVEAGAKPVDAERYVTISGRSPKIAITWGALGGDAKYRLVVGKGRDPLVDPVVDTTTTANRAVVDPLPPGRYSWNVYLADKGSTVSLLSGPRSLWVVSPRKPRVDTRGIWK